MMARNENREMFTGLALDLLKIGAKALVPAAMDAFYEYRDKVLETLAVTPEERAELLEWIGVNVGGAARFEPPAGTPAGTPPFPTVPPPPQTVTPASGNVEPDRPWRLGQSLASMPDTSLVMADEQVWQLDNEPRFYVEKKQTMVGDPEPGSGWHVVYPVPTPTES